MVKIQQQLDSARKAYHELVTGRLARVVVDQNGERVEFTVANRTALYNYILQLEAQLATPKLPDNGPARFIF